MKTHRNPPPPPRQAGIALILVLWVLVLLTIIAGSFAYSVHGNTQMAANAVALSKAQAFADGGVFRGVFELLSGQAGPTAWRPDGQTHQMQLDRQGIAVTITDESGKIDLNGAPPALLAGMLQSVGLESGRAVQLAQVIAAWRAPLPTGAGLAPPIGAVPPHGPFRNIEELRQVPGISGAIFRRVAPLVTIYTGLPGVNTAIAPEPVLRAIPGVSAAQASAYAQQRNALLQARQTVPPLTEVGAYNIGTLSGIVSIRADVRLDDGVAFSREAVIRVTNQPGKPYQILSWREDFPGPQRAISGNPA